ncbi:hypothetical protein MAR_022088, partial [Mya arenaria]
MILRRVHLSVRRRRNIWALTMIVGTGMVIYLTLNHFPCSELMPTSEEKIYQVTTPDAKKSSILKDIKDLPVEDGFSRAEYLRHACENSIHRSGNKKVR